MKSLHMTLWSWMIKFARLLGQDILSAWMSLSQKVGNAVLSQHYGLFKYRPVCCRTFNGRTATCEH